MKTPSIVDAMSDAKLLGSTFEDPSWDPWRVVLKAAFGIPLSSPRERRLFFRCTGRRTPPPAQVRELWLPCGRRSGKSRIVALIATYLACFGNHAKSVSAGERPKVLVLSVDRAQSRVVFRYCSALFDASPILRSLVESKTQNSIGLTSGLDIEVHASSYRGLRGYSIAGVVADEISFWRSDEWSSNPDREILAAIRPGMASIQDSMLIAISSPYSRRGVLWEAYQRHYGKDDPATLVWQASSREMNPLLSKEIVDRAYREDPLAAAEYGAQFRRDVESFVALEPIEACTVAGRHEVPPMPSTKYFGFVDPSGGSQDSMTLAIAHVEKGVAMLDAIREVVPPFSPDEVVREFCDLLKAYRVPAVQGDRYAGQWPTSRFAAHGIRYDANAAVKSELYKSLLPALNSGQIELLDNKRLKAQLLGLERRTSRGGKDSIDHRPRSHDDVANSVAGVFVTAMGKRVPMGVPIGVGYRPSPWHPGAPSRIPAHLDWRASDYDG